MKFQSLLALTLLVLSRQAGQTGRPFPATSILRKLKNYGKQFRLLLCTSLLSGLILPAYGAVTIDYSYDDLNRLGSVTRSDGPAIAFQYDGAGNFTGQGVSNSPDTDGDLIANFADPDDDADGMPDVWETQYGFNPLDAGDAVLDANGNGISNLAEYQANSNPIQSTNTSVAVPAVPEWGLIIMALALLGIAAQHSKRQGS